MTRRRHPDFPLFVYNYTVRTTTSRHWTDVTEQCRGLILDENHNVVARPFRKFFSVSEWTESLVRPLPSGPFDTYDKLDGSLGISFMAPDGSLGVSTRGSFQSEQAVVGTGFLRAIASNAWIDPTLTYLFEIIYPENRYVVNYGDYQGLVLLGVIDSPFWY